MHKSIYIFLLLELMKIESVLHGSANQCLTAVSINTLGLAMLEKMIT